MFVRSRFLRFSLVGVVGFGVDAGVLQVLVAMLGWNAVAARLISIPVAVVATWLLNRNITFSESRDAPAYKSLLRYAAVSAAGAAVNFVIYTALVISSSLMALHPVVPLAVASIVALVVNYLGSKYFAFR
jgi:putative flippase GtrA